MPSKDTVGHHLFFLFCFSYEKNGFDKFYYHDALPQHKLQQSSLRNYTWCSNCNKASICRVGRLSQILLWFIVRCPLKASCNQRQSFWKDYEINKADWLLGGGVWSGRGGTLRCDLDGCVSFPGSSLAAMRWALVLRQASVSGCCALEPANGSLSQNKSLLHQVESIVPGMGKVTHRYYNLYIMSNFFIT